ncbi:MAG: DUF5050 domain-containing protein, partial [Chloroflexi bacterium]|nr:DUF5050 domain-containing protein [Chloroflexota bacterium]
MNCNEIQLKLVSYLDNALPDWEREDIEYHLSVCPGCREELGALANIQAVFHQAFEETAARAYPSTGAWTEFERRMAKPKRRSVPTFGWAKTIFAGLSRTFGKRRLWQKAFAIVLVAAITATLLVTDPFARMSPSGMLASAAETTGSVQTLHASVETTGDYYASYEIDYNSSGQWDLIDNSPQSDSIQYRNVDSMLYYRSSNDSGWLQDDNPHIHQIDETIAQISPTANAVKLTWLSEADNAAEIVVLPDEVISGINCVRYRATYGADENQPIIIDYWIGKSDHLVYKQSYSDAWTTTSDINLYGNFFAQGTVISITSTTTFTAIDRPVTIVVPSSSAIQPLISNISAFDITVIHATIGWTTNVPATSQVEYGETNLYGATTTLDNTLKTSHSVTLAGLEAGTLYHFRVKSENGSGNEAISGDNTFTPTAAIDITEPIISNVSSADITHNSVVISWSTDETATSLIEYGLSDTYGSTTALNTALTTTHGIALTGLESDTIYHYRVKSMDGSDNEAVSGDNSFTTDVGGDSGGEQQPGWNTQTVDFPGGQPSLALDNNGNPAMSYFYHNGNNLRYAHWNGTSWDIETVDSADGAVGVNSSLSFDSNNNPAISYADADNHLKIARWNGLSWEMELVDSDGLVSDHSSLVFDSNGDPGISYYYISSNDLKYAYWDGSNWDVHVIDSGVNTSSSLAFDSNSNPVICYTNQDVHLKFAQWNGLNWDIQVVDTEGEGYPSLAFDSNGNPVISYQDKDRYHLKLARWDGSSWNIETVDSSNPVWAKGLGSISSLAFDINGNPAISYSDITNNNDRIKFAWFNGSSWDIDVLGPSLDTICQSSLAFDSQGRPHVVYHGQDNAMKYAYYNDSNGSGDKIAFASIRDGNWEIYTMDADGTGQTNNTNNPEDDSRPAWSPDGSSIAFTSYRDGNWEIYTMDADGGNPTRITYNTAIDFTPSWSPDGTKIAFYSTRDGNREIYVMNADGTNQTRLTNNPASDRSPSWSSDSSKIALYSDRDGNDEIYVMNADGTGLINITSNPAKDYFAAWSPDGAKIVFVSDRDGNQEIYTMNVDGSSSTKLTDSSGVNYAPTWSSDGSKIAFVADNNGNLEIYTMNAD